MANKMRVMRLSIVIALAAVVIVLFLMRETYLVKNKDHNSGITEHFASLCEASTKVQVINAKRWKEYVELAKKNVVRTDKKISLVQIDGYRFAFGSKRNPMASSFPPGLHDEEVFITYNGHDIAVLFNQVKVVDSVGALTSFSCLDDGLNNFLSTEVM